MSMNTSGEHRAKVAVAVIGAISTLGVAALGAGLFHTPPTPEPTPTEQAPPSEEDEEPTDVPFEPATPGVPDGPTVAPTPSEPATHPPGSERPTTDASEDTTPADAEPATTALTSGSLTLSQPNGFDLDTADPVALPLATTSGLDIGLTQYAPRINSADGATLVRTTSQPTIDTCSAAQGGTTQSNDYAVDHWFCFGTSEGRTGFFQVTDITETATGTTVTIDWTLDGDPAPPAAETTTAATTATLTLSQPNGFDLDTAAPVALPLATTSGLDIGLTQYAPRITSADGATLVRTTSRPTIDTCSAAQGGTTQSNDYAVDHWFCFGTSEGRTGFFQVTDITETATGTTVTIDTTLED